MHSFLKTRRNLNRFLPFYAKKCNIKTIITPGTPKNPTINAVIQFISKTKPNLAPTRLIRNNIAPPRKAFIINLIIILNGNAISFNIANKITIAIKKVKTFIFSPPIFTFNNTWNI